MVTNMIIIYYFGTPRESTMYIKTKGLKRDRNGMQRELVDGDENASKKGENNERTMKTKFFSKQNTI